MLVSLFIKTKIKQLNSDMVKLFITYREPTLDNKFK